MIQVIITVVLLGLFLLFIYQPAIFLFTSDYSLQWLVLCLGLALIITFVKALFSKHVHLRQPLSYVHVFLPLLLQISIYFFVAYLPAVHFLVIAFIAIAYGIMIFLLEIALQDLRGYKAVPFHIARITLNTITLVTGYCFFYALYSSNLDSVFATLLIFLFLFFLFFQSTLWWSKRDVFLSAYVSFVVAYLGTQLFWVIGYLPHIPFVTALIMFNLQHVAMGVIQNYCKKQLTIRVVGEYLVFALLLITVILVFSQWFPLYTV